MPRRWKARRWRPPSSWAGPKWRRTAWCGWACRKCSGCGGGAAAGRSCSTDHPDLSIDLLALPRFANLANREADLGVMLDPPSTGRYMVTRLASFRFYLYASPLPGEAPADPPHADLERHDFVDYVQDRLASRELSYLNELGFTPRRRLCCSGMTAQIEAASLGMGLMMAPPYAVPDDGRLVPVLPGFFAERSFWLAAPTDLYRLRRVKVVWDLLRDLADNNPKLWWHNGDMGRAA
jgi:DNA-binding transcriptional LysR family regulator